MDVKARLARWAFSRPHVLVFGGPGTEPLRWQLEAELDRRAWRIADAPADADAVVVLGRPGLALAAAADLLFRQVPAPKVRVDVLHAHDLPERLVDAAEDLHNRAEQSRLVRSAASSHEKGNEHGGDNEHSEHTQPPTHHAAAGTGAEERAGGHAHGEMQHGAAGEDLGAGDVHVHHDGEVAGLAMASTAPDRDGLDLDSLDVSLGPWLPGWPTGLVVQGALQGDVLTGVRAHWLDADHVTPGPPGSLDVQALDLLAGFLVVAGWPRAAAEARAARTALLTRLDDGRRLAQRVARRVGGSRTLAWQVRGLGVAGDGDVLDRLRGWCAVAADPASAPPHSFTVEELADLLEGAELAAVRLVVASAAPLQVPRRHPVEAHHG